MQVQVLVREQAPAGRDRGASHVGHERGRGSLRVGEDVSAAGEELEPRVDIGRIEECGNVVTWTAAGL